jgi:hypothetical protein
MTRRCGGACSESTQDYLVFLCLNPVDRPLTLSTHESRFDDSLFLFGVKPVDRPSRPLTGFLKSIYQQLFPSLFHFPPAQTIQFHVCITSTVKYPIVQLGLKSVLPDFLTGEIRYIVTACFSRNRFQNRHLTESGIPG